MKTLVNKNNPQIRITAPEIELWIESAYVVGQHLSETEDSRDIVLVVDRKDWTLVETLFDTAKHFYELGLKARKEE